MSIQQCSAKIHYPPVKIALAALDTMTDRGPPHPNNISDSAPQPAPECRTNPMTSINSCWAGAGAGTWLWLVGWLADASAFRFLIVSDREREKKVSFARENNISHRRSPWERLDSDDHMGKFVPQATCPWEAAGFGRQIVGWLFCCCCCWWFCFDHLQHMFRRVMYFYVFYWVMDARNVERNLRNSISFSCCCFRQFSKMTLWHSFCFGEGLKREKSLKETINQKTKELNFSSKNKRKVMASRLSKFFLFSSILNLTLLNRICKASNYTKK